MRKKTFAKGSLLMMTMLVSSNMMAGTPELEGNAIFFAMAYDFLKNIFLCHD